MQCITEDGHEAVQDVVVGPFFDTVTGKPVARGDRIRRDRNLTAKCVGTGETGRHVTETSLNISAVHLSGLLMKPHTALLAGVRLETWRPRFVAATPRHMRRITVARN